MRGTLHAFGLAVSPPHRLARTNSKAIMVQRDAALAAYFVLMQPIRVRSALARAGKPESVPSRHRDRHHKMLGHAQRTLWISCRLLGQRRPGGCAAAVTCASSSGADHVTSG